MKANRQLIHKPFIIALMAILGFSFTTQSAEIDMSQPNDITTTGGESTCPDFLNQSYRRLHSDEDINLCSLYSEKAMLIVNTASHCGFTKQFEGLEALHKKYQDQGLVIVGFSSNDFMQESKDEAKAASICFENFGVSFTMISPSKVRGKKANPTFLHLAELSKKPSWNFNKYLITNQGATVTHFGARTKPLDSKLERAIQAAL